MATLSRGLGLSSEKVRAHLAQVRKDYCDPSIHAYHKVYVFLLSYRRCIYLLTVILGMLCTVRSR